MRSLRVGMAVLAATLFAGSVVAAEVAPVCSDWNVVATPTSGKGNNLRSVDALDASNAWAVGQTWNGTRGGAPVAMRWDGLAWTAEPIPDLTYLGMQPTLQAVGIAPKGDPWVVGHLRDASAGTNVALILRWSGGFWQAHDVAMLDSFAPRYPLLRDVAAIAENDAWAVGEAETQVKGAIEPFAAHWDGTAWSEVAVPGTAGGNRVITAVSAAASDAVWAVGYDVDPAMKDTSYARIYRWDGSAWTVVDQPAATKAGSALHDIVALAADDVWAVGEIGTDASLFLHWDGSVWTTSLAPANAPPLSVDGAMSSDVWAAGAKGNYHWDGTIWTFLPLGTQDTGARRVLAAAGLCDAWSISSWSNSDGSTSLVERLGPSAPAPEPPPTPLAFAVKPLTSKQVFIEWLPGGDPTGGVGATFFVIESCVGEAGACLKPFTVIQKVVGKVTSYVDSGLEPGTFYTYRVYALNDAGKSEPTAPATARTLESAPSPLPAPGPDGTQTDRGPQAPEASPESIPLPPYAPPATPMGFVVKPATSRQIVLAWVSGDPTGGVGSTFFVIESCVGEAGACLKPFTVIQKVGGKVTSFVDSGLAPGTFHTYRVYALNDAGKSEPTAPATARTLDEDSPLPLPQPGLDGTKSDRGPRAPEASPESIPLPPYAPPATPMGFVVKPETSRQIVLAWVPGDSTGPVGPTFFVIERCVSDAGACLKPFTVIQKVGVKVTFFADSGLQPGTFYTYRVYAVNDAGTSEPTAPATARTLDEGAPSPLPEPGLDGTKSDRGPRAPKASPESIPVPPYGPPATPIGFVAKPATSRQVGLAWVPGDSTGAVGPTLFVIERCVSEAGACLKPFTVIQKVGGKVTSYVDSGLEPATSYTYRVYAVNDAGTSEPTAPATARTMAEDSPSPLPEPVQVRTQAQRPAPPATPTAFAVKPATSRQIVLGWVSGDDPTGAAGRTAFVIERCVGEAGVCATRFAIIGKAGGKATSFIDSGLEPATSYTYRIYAMNEAGKSAPTAPETARTLPPRDRDPKVR